MVNQVLFQEYNLKDYYYWQLQNLNLDTLDASVMLKLKGSLQLQEKRESERANAAL